MGAPMLNNAPHIIKIIGALVFIGVAFTLAIALFLSHDYSAPAEIRGCYFSKLGQEVVLGKDDIRLGRKEPESISIKFKKTNVGDQLNLSPGIVIKIGEGATVEFAHEEPGNVVRVSEGILMFSTDAGDEVPFHKASC